MGAVAVECSSCIFVEGMMFRFMCVALSAFPFHQLKSCVFRRSTKPSVNQVGHQSLACGLPQHFLLLTTKYKVMPYKGYTWGAVIFHIPKYSFIVIIHYRTAQWNYVTHTENV